MDENRKKQLHDANAKARTLLEYLLKLHIQHGGRDPRVGMNAETLTACGLDREAYAIASGRLLTKGLATQHGSPPRITLTAHGANVAEDDAALDQVLPVG